jgi:polyisoprenoid-binding protein YceI
MNKILLTGLLIASSVFAECSYQAQQPNVTWKAFKNYEKIGVGGSFDRAVLQSTSTDSIEKVLLLSTITIDTSRINSGNPGRDATLTHAFFMVQNINSITARVAFAKEGKAQINISMNGVTKTIPMSYTVVGKEKIIGKGTIDLADFGMIPSLQSLNKACFDLHSGKTWQDVEIGFEIPMKTTCK